MRPAQRHAGICAFTLPELMVAMGLCTMVLGGVLISHMFGMRLLEKTRTSLSASADMQKALNRLVPEVRSARTVRLGLWTNGVFQTMPLGSPLRGNAVRIYASEQTNRFVQYAWESATHEIRRITSANEIQTVLRGAAPGTGFTAEDASGRVLTNAASSFVVGLQVRFDGAVAQSNNLMEAKVAFRANE